MRGRGVFRPLILKPGRAEGSTGGVFRPLILKPGRAEGSTWEFLSKTGWGSNIRGKHPDPTIK